MVDNENDNVGRSNNDGFIVHIIEDKNNIGVNDENDQKEKSKAKEKSFTKSKAARSKLA